MTKEKIEGSPLKRRLMLGATPPEKERGSNEEHKDIKTSKHKNTMKRTTIYMPEELLTRLKIYAVRHHDDVSGILIKQAEKLLSEEE